MMRLVADPARPASAQFPSTPNSTVPISLKFAIATIQGESATTAAKYISHEFLGKAALSHWNWEKESEKPCVAVRTS